MILDLTGKLADSFGVAPDVVNYLFADIAGSTTLHEYAHMVESIASRLGAHHRMTPAQISAVTRAYWMSFLQRHQEICLYDGVVETLTEIRRKHRDIQIIILTDAPEWIAVERLWQVGILHLIDGVAAIKTVAPRLELNLYNQCIKDTRSFLRERMKRIDRSHLKLTVSLPRSFAKPSHLGIDVVVRKLGLKRGKVIICGDKDTKEGEAAERWSQRRKSDYHSEIFFVRADYGNHDVDDPRYVHLSKKITSLKAPERPVKGALPQSRAIDKFTQLAELIQELFGKKRPGRERIVTARHDFARQRLNA